jgi:hypothetical protein
VDGIINALVIPDKQPITIVMIDSLDIDEERTLWRDRLLAGGLLDHVHRSLSE